MAFSRTSILWALVLAAAIQPGPALPEERIEILCEIIETEKCSESISTGEFFQMHYALLRHANAGDRETLSKWLRDHGGRKIDFVHKGVSEEAVLWRLGNCFGRGLLIYKAGINLEKRDLIKLVLPTNR
jgi:hypothetical protein